MSTKILNIFYSETVGTSFCQVRFFCFCFFSVGSNVGLYRADYLGNKIWDAASWEERAVICTIYFSPYSTSYQQPTMCFVLNRHTYEILFSSELKQLNSRRIGRMSEHRCRKGLIQKKKRKTKQAISLISHKWMNEWIIWNWLNKEKI